MCGIIGYIGLDDALPIVIDGLSKLEYRGYDSAGVCLKHDGLTILKKSGRLQALKDILPQDLPAVNLGMGHTRWATHGPPVDVNAHPHTDKSGKLALIHNGIIENHQEIKHLLAQKGHTFSSHTDTEVLAHLIGSFYEGDLAEAVVRALALVEGAFGIVVMHEDHEELVAARRGSPLVLGIGEKEFIFASDVPALLSRTRNVIYLDDDEIVRCTKDSYTIHTLSGSEVTPDIHEVKWTVEELAKGNYKHFMLKEIYEQPDAVANTLRGRITPDGTKLTVDTSGVKRILIVACGTSRFASLLGAHYIEKLAGIPAHVDFASEFRYRDPLIQQGDLVIASSQSGETADTLAAMKEARRRGAKLLGIVNVVGSSIAREVDSGIYLHAGPEIGVASTKAFICQVTAFLLLAIHLAEERGKSYKHLLSELNGLPDAVKHTLELAKDIEEIAKKYMHHSHMLYLGRGYQFPVALEGALKLKELSYIHAEGLPAAEMKHGPIALIDENMPVFFLAPKDATYEKVLSNMQEVHARGGKIIALVTDDDEQISELAEHIIKIPQASNELLPILSVIPLQLFAYHLADLKELDVDKPRNLAKSVTVE